MFFLQEFENCFTEITRQTFLVRRETVRVEMLILDARYSANAKSCANPWTVKNKDKEEEEDGDNEHSAEEELLIATDE